MKHVWGRVAIGIASLIICCHNGYAQECNHLNWVQISQTKLSTQIMFDFQDPVHFDHELIKDKHQLKFIFPGMSLQSFNHEHVLSRLLTLKEKGLIKKINLYEKKGAVPHVILSLQFATSRKEVGTNNKSVHLKKNKLLVKWNTLETPARLIVDIFIKENLDNLIKKSATILHAKNDIQQFDTPLHAYNEKKTSPRIILDPGHGGDDTGAKSRSGLAEKDITLDITKKLTSLLKKNGYNALLTRSSDKTVSLFHRAQIANQLKADLLVSIHVNSSPPKTQKSAWGIETFYIEDSCVFPQQKGINGIFINCDPNKKLLTFLKNYSKSSLHKSKTLAKSIQKSIIQILKSNNIQTKNRGIKKDSFRVFLQTEAPAALVEVGFITNPKEAARLAKASYRSLVAKGIYAGICSYIKSIQH